MIYYKKLNDQNRQIVKYHTLENENVKTIREKR